MLHLPVAKTRTANSFVIYCVLPTAPIIFAPVAWYHILLVANPINRYLIKKRVNPFVSRAVPRAQRKQTMRIEVRVADCRWQRCAFPNPAQDFRKIARVAAFDGAPVKFAEHPTPIPLPHVLLCADFLPLVTDNRILAVLSVSADLIVR